MLVLNRRVGTAIYIGDDITVTVIGIKGESVSIGINASRDVPVYREEVYMKIQRDLIKNSNMKIDDFDKSKLEVA